MKRILYVILLFAVIVSCKDKTFPQIEEETSPEEELNLPTAHYPQNFMQVLKAHGDIDVWNEMETLEFSVEKPDGYEITTTDLKDGYSLIERPDTTLGFDGEVFWMKNKKNGSFKEEPKTYVDAMFKLYAMPFVLADENAKYETVESFSFDGKTYPGIQVSYPDADLDKYGQDYIVYYDADLYEMRWLAYKSSNTTTDSEWNFINYTKWQEVEGLMLPETMIWYHVENGQPTTVNREVQFVSPMLTPVKMDIRVYGRPEGGELIK